MFLGLSNLTQRGGGGYRAQRGEILELCFLVSMNYFKAFASEFWLTETANRI